MLNFGVYGFYEDKEASYYLVSRSNIVYYMRHTKENDKWVSITILPYSPVTLAIRWSTPEESSALFSFIKRRSLKVLLNYSMSINAKKMFDHYLSELPEEKIKYISFDRALSVSKGDV